MGCFDTEDGEEKCARLVQLFMGRLKTLFLEKSAVLAHSLWTHMLRLFGIEWVMPGSVADLLFCWYHWLGKHSSDIWNLVPGCLMWNIWTEWNRRSFENKGKTVAQLIDLCQRTLFDWSRCWGFSDCFTLMEFLSSISFS